MPSLINRKLEVVIKNLENKNNKGDLEAARKALNTPLKDKALKLLSQKAPLKEILANGAKKARMIAKEKLEKVNQVIF